MFGDVPYTTLYAKLVAPQNGYQIDQENAKALTVGAFYKVARVSMGQSNTSVWLEDVDGLFNSVQFEFYELNEKELDIYNMPEFNHYMNISSHVEGQ